MMHHRLPVLRAYKRWYETELRQHNLRNLQEIQFDKAASSTNVDVANIDLAVNAMGEQEKWHAGNAAQRYL